jgi:hypothetical protein
MFVWRTYGTALWATAGGAIGLDNGIRPTDTGSEYHGVGFTTFACVRFRTYRTPLVFRQHRDRRELQLAFLGSDRTRVCTVRTCRLKLDGFVVERWVLVSHLRFVLQLQGSNWKCVFLLEAARVVRTVVHVQSKPFL